MELLNTTMSASEKFAVENEVNNFNKMNAVNGRDRKSVV